MIEFKKTQDPNNKFSISEVSIKVHDEVTITDLLEEFGNFLKACGYSFDGELDIVNDDYDESKFNNVVSDDADNDLDLEYEVDFSDERLGETVDQRTS